MIQVSGIRNAIDKRHDAIRIPIALDHCLLIRFFSSSKPLTLGMVVCISRRASRGNAAARQVLAMPLPYRTGYEGYSGKDLLMSSSSFRSPT
jgi:hypothetical protein